MGEEEIKQSLVYVKTDVLIASSVLRLGLSPPVPLFVPVHARMREKRGVSEHQAKLTIKSGIIRV